jgi:internalin A
VKAVIKKLCIATILVILVLSTGCTYATNSTEVGEDVFDPVSYGELFISFIDANFQAVVRAAANKTEGDLTTADLAKVVVLWGREKGISSIDGIELLPNLEWAELCFNQISDLTSLGYLEVTGPLEIQLADNEISDLGPLQYLTSPAELRLSLGGNRITDLSPLAGLTNMIWLCIEADVEFDGKPIDGNRIEDISAVAGMHNLTTLTMWGNEISDLSPVRDLNNLKLLDAGYNEISDLSPLTGLINLECLVLRYNRISDITPLLSMTQLTLLDLKGNPITEEDKQLLENTLVNTRIGFD